MIFRVAKFLCVALFVLCGFFSASAQVDASDEKPQDYPLSIKESFAKQRIKSEEKDFNEMLDRSEEAAKISNELYKSYEINQKLTPDDAKKAERLEKLVKKIRDELGSENDGSNDTPTDNSLPSFGGALKNISETSSNLFTELKKQGRFSISVGAVESSNTLLKLIRFVRQKPN